MTYCSYFVGQIDGQTKTQKMCSAPPINRERWSIAAIDIQALFVNVSFELSKQV
jgi:hypothetical protein